MRSKQAPPYRSRPLVLASRSPRRIALLQQLGLAFEVRPSDVDERQAGGGRPDERAVAAARMKGEEVARRTPGRLILGADTIVWLEDRILGKPRDANEARAMLRGLRGRFHTVVTGLCLIAPEEPPWIAAEVTRVRMADFSDAEMEAYIATGEPFDKAGGYAIQGEAGRFVMGVDGDYFNVVGLPLGLLRMGLARFVDVSHLVVPRPPGRFASC